MVPVFRGNLIRTLIAGSIYISIGLYIATWVSPFFTSAAKAADFDFGAFTNISSLVDGAVWTTFLLLGSAKFMGWIGLGILGDRKSTRLNSSHVAISYAVFCLKQKRHDLSLCLDVVN